MVFDLLFDGSPDCTGGYPESAVEELNYTTLYNESTMVEKPTVWASYCIRTSAVEAGEC